jgi:transposase InsO family protein
MVIKIHKDNPSYGAPKINGELKNIYIKMCNTSIRNIIKKFYYNNPPKSTGKWKKFIKSLGRSIFACDYKIVTDRDGNKIYVLFLMNIFTRKIVHYNLTYHPNKRWQERQLRELTDGSENINLITDNDGVYKGVDFEMLGINRIRIKPFCPKMNAHIERFIGSFKREALKYYIKDQLTFDKAGEIAKEYVHFYNNYRPHQGIGNVTLPKYEHGQPVLQEGFSVSKVKRKTFLGGAHSYYYLKNCA